MKPRTLRLRKLVNRRLQLRLAAVSAGLVTVTLLLQYPLLTMKLSAAAASLPSGGDHLMDWMPGIVLDCLLTAFALVLPLSVAVAIVSTFRLAGPLHRIERYLERYAAGEESGPCRIRRGDELQGLCDKLNAALEHARAIEAREHELPADETDELRAA